MDPSTAAFFGTQSSELLPPPVHSALYHAGLLRQQPPPQQQQSGTPSRRPVGNRNMEGGSNNQTPLQLGKMFAAARTLDTTQPQVLLYANRDRDPQQDGPSCSFDRVNAIPTEKRRTRECWSLAARMEGKELPSPSARPFASHASPLPQRPLPMGFPGKYSNAASVGQYFNGAVVGGDNGYTLPESHGYGGGCYGYYGGPPGGESHAQKTPSGLSTSQSASKSFTHSNSSGLQQSPSPTHASTSALMLRSASATADAGGFAGRSMRSGGISPRNGEGDATSSTAVSPLLDGRSGLSLERQLLSARKEELVQMLMELGSCNTAAAVFICGRAHSFGLPHHDHASGEERKPHRMDINNGGDPSGAVGAADVRPATEREEEEVGGVPVEESEKEASGGGGGGDSQRCCRGASRRLLDGDANECSFAANTPACAEDVECSITASSVRSEGVTAADVSHCSSNNNGGRRPPLRQQPQGRLPPHERPFAVALHPCLHWYGACRNAASCVFAPTPRNLCLDWVRGSCTAGAQCSGVHRLPEGCPREVRTIFELSTGCLSRHEAMLARRAAHDHPHRSLGEGATEDGVSTPKGQLLRNDQDPLSVGNSPHPHTNRFLSPREATASDEAERAANDGVRTPIGPKAPRWQVAASMPAASSPFRDYFGQKTYHSTGGVAVRPAHERATPSRLPGRPADSAQPRRPHSSGSGSGDVHVHRCLNDSFDRAQQDDDDAGSPTTTTAADRKGTRVVRGAAFCADSPPLVDSPLRLSAAVEEDYDSTAPCVGTHTRTHTPE